LEVLILEVEDVLHLWVDNHLGQLTRLAAKLQLNLIHVVEIDMRITCSMDELAGLEATDLSHHHTQQGIRGNVEGNAQEAVGTTLIELQAKLTVCHIELEESMAGGQIHILDVGHIPGADNDTTTIGIILDGIYCLLNLVYEASVVIRPRTPLVAIDMAQVARNRVGPLIPDTYTTLL
jgi:hypothetical protein